MGADPEEVKANIELVSWFLLLASQGLMDVYFGDESGFGMQPFVPYCYQKKGEQLAIPSTRAKVVNVLGFLNPITSRLITYRVPEDKTMQSGVFVSLMDDFADQIRTETVVVLDNASWHKSKLTRSKFGEWQRKGLFIHFLPPRCPHLNLIETLWRKINRVAWRYEWLKTADFYSVKTMKKKLKRIFQQYGDEFQINFSMDIFKTKFNW